MEFDLELVRVRLFAHRKRIAGEFGVGEPAGTPCDFADQIVDALGQPTTRKPLSQFIDDRCLFKAACLAIWSSSIDWSLVIAREDDLRTAFHDYDPIATCRDFRDGKLSADDIARILGAQYGKSQAAWMLAWACRLADTPEYYGTVIRLIAEQIQEIADTDEVTDPELMLCMAVYFALVDGGGWVGNSRLAAAGHQLPAPAERKFTGMGFPICCEFFRNLGWSGFKPDTHITRLFDHWQSTLGLALDDYLPRARVLAGYVGRTDSELVKYVQYGLAGNDLTPVGVSPSRADNLIWLLGKYGETKGHESDGPYLND